MATYQEPHLPTTQDEEQPSGPVTSAGITLSRLLLTLFNAVLILFGTILVIVGISAHNHLNNYIDLVGNDNINNAALTLIISGIICVLTALMSYLAAKRQAVCVLYLTSSILFIIFIAVTVAATGAVVYHGKIDTIFKEGMNKTISKAYWDESTFQPNPFMKTIGILQERLDCCGIDSYQDWANLNSNFNIHNVPVSCCKTEFCGEVIDGSVQLHPDENAGYHTEKIYTGGCYKQITDFVSTNTVAVLICSYGLAIFQLVGIIFSCCLCKAISGAGSYRNIRSGSEY